MSKVMAVLICLSAVIFGFAMVASAAGTTDTTNSVLMKIPFAFHAGDKLFPAGQYRIELPQMGGYATGTIVRVSTPDGTECQYLFSMRSNGSVADTDYHVTFNKYGEEYFITKVRNSDLGVDFAKSRTEKKLASEHAKVSGAVSSVEVVSAPSKAK